ncbi:hypothetical protein PoB_002426300 [Plakobranchus ocellatus]|uniref:Uncharacterized protein n=1 Tax=Plakobranchus ocellatus TaxID=259542 RepID=A0AAV3ZSD3_9GAST|nr:hypothetical protein PoB_002426300 [Plakobranchus ocellatus]
MTTLVLTTTNTTTSTSTTSTTRSIAPQIPQPELPVVRPATLSKPSLASPVQLPSLTPRPPIPYHTTTTSITCTTTHYSTFPSTIMYINNSTSLISTSRTATTNAASPH